MHTKVGYPQPIPPKDLSFRSFLPIIIVVAFTCLASPFLKIKPNALATNTAAPQTQTAPTPKTPKNQPAVKLANLNR